MLISLGAIKIKNELDLYYLGLVLEGHMNQTKEIKFYLGISCKPNLEIQIRSILEKYDKISFKLDTTDIYFFNNLINLYDHFKNDINELQNSWILFSEFGIWHHKRVECFNNCLEGMDNFKPRERIGVKYVRIPRSVYTGERFGEKDNYASIDKFLNEGQIICNENTSWGEIGEYVVRKEVFDTFLVKFREQHIKLVKRPNCVRYFLKYLNCNQFKFLNLNTEKITIDFWMFFYFYNEPNTYFKPTKNLDIYEDSFQSIIDKDIIHQKSIIYDVGSKVTTKLGPGIIQNIKDKVYTVNIEWEDNREETKTFVLQDLHQCDKNESRKGLYVFIANLLNNIELYLTNYVFDNENPPTYDNFKDIISLFIKEGKSKLKSNDLFEKLGTLLDYREKILDEKIYHNNLTKNIFNHIIENSLFKTIKNIEKI